MIALLLFALFLFFGSLFFREQSIPGGFVSDWMAKELPTNLVVRVESVEMGFRACRVRGLRVYDLARANATEAMAKAELIEIEPWNRFVRVVGAEYARLPDSYYAPGNLEKNARVEGRFPPIGAFRLELEKPNILSVTPARVTAKVIVDSHRIDFSNVHLDWENHEPISCLDGFCYLDLDRQEIYGEVEGLATQAQIRPMIVALDVPVALPYMDGFTDVPEKVPAWCGWKVNLTNNDFDLWLRLKPVLGKYNTVPMKGANGKIHLHSYTRGTCLNYHTEVGPIEAEDVKDRPLSGTVDIVGTNGYNVVTVEAKSGQPLADILKIGGFTGDYVSKDVVGCSDCRLQFRFPRAMTNNYELMDGEGHIAVTNGHLKQFKLFAGLTEELAKRVPGVSQIVDQTDASLDYKIEKGVLSSDNIFIEGGLFSIKMFGQFDAVKGEIDFTVRVQFTKKDSLLGKYIVHPITWPFTKLLLEFRLSGTPDKPEWEYITVVDRVLEVLQ